MKTIAFLMTSIALLSGCKSSYESNVQYPSYYLTAKDLGDFPIDKGVNGVDSLMLKLQGLAPAKLEKYNVEAPLFEADRTRQWAVFTCRHEYIYWKIGIQFIIDPSNDKNILAIARSIGTSNGISPDPRRIDPFIKIVRDSLKAASQEGLTTP
ncbi:hypothetical protein [Pseudomonas nitroreducens]|uniref:hypothetical protein n=1 Tax=Pseudomonas nitroreducens TaxID=46680 RepID=UPI001873AE3A|nr:hypothetical protein [Pseudomonas nitritireducens]